jgi:hypothetical protein
MTVTDVARICHEANRALCAGLGDHSQKPWDDAPEWQRTSAVNGVKFNLEHPDAPPSASHDSWLAEKYAHGWKFGPIKDAELREHPCCVPYEELPKDQQVKDHLFKSICNAVEPIVEASHG